jgi:hypothetical protein
MLAASAGLILCAPHAVTAQTPSAQARLAMVDPFIGTGPDGHTFLGATVPFGDEPSSHWVGGHGTSFGSGRLRGCPRSNRKNRALCLYDDWKHP